MNALIEEFKSFLYDVYGFNLGDIVYLKTSNQTYQITNASVEIDGSIMFYIDGEAGGRIVFPQQITSEKPVLWGKE